MVPGEESAVKLIEDQIYNLIISERRKGSSSGLYWAQAKQKTYYIISALSFIQGKTADLGSRIYTPLSRLNVIVETQQRLIDCP